MNRTEHVDTLSASGRLRLHNRCVAVKYVIRTYQDYDGELRTLTHARGGLQGLSAGDATFAMMDGKPVEIELEDGRKAKVLITNTDGEFVVTGPIV